MIKAVLFDLDGVVRHFVPDPGLAARHGIAEGAIEEAAFASPLIDELITGRISRATWIRRIGDALGARPGAEEWGRTPFVVDDEVVELAQELRGRGIRPAILTNGTDTIASEMAVSGITQHFDAIFNSADIGFAKPDRRAFTHVLDAFAVRGEEVFFTDDSLSKLAGADALGMHTHHFTGMFPLREALDRTIRAENLS